MKNFLQRLMQGRYGGNDSFNAFLFFIALSCMIGYYIFHTPLLNFITFLCLGYNLYRGMSRNIPARYRENQKFLDWLYPIRSRLLILRRNFRDRKVYKYFQCPYCRQTLRVPRGKGKIILRCKKCGKKFEARS